MDDQEEEHTHQGTAACIQLHLADDPTLFDTSAQESNRAMVMAFCKARHEKGFLSLPYLTKLLNKYTF